MYENTNRRAPLEQAPIISSFGILVRGLSQAESLGLCEIAFFWRKGQPTAARCWIQNHPTFICKFEKGYPVEPGYFRFLHFMEYLGVSYWLATIIMLLEIIGLFCKRAL